MPDPVSSAYAFTRLPMPQPPNVPILTQYLFDSAWLLVVLLLLVAAGLVLAWRSSRNRMFMVLAISAVSIALCSFLVERMVVTSGERAESVVRALVAAAEQGDIPSAAALFSDDATMSLIDPKNPGIGIGEIRRRLEMLGAGARYAIESNAITSLESFSESPVRGIVHLRVRTELESGLGYPVFSAWVFRIEMGADADSWKIRQITFVEFNHQSPTGSVFR